MAEPKKKSVPPSSAAKSSAEEAETSSSLSGFASREEMDTLSTLAAD